VIKVVSDVTLIDDYQDERDYFFKAINRFDIARRVVSKAALTKARMTLKYEAFIELNLQLVDHFLPC